MVVCGLFVSKTGQKNCNVSRDCAVAERELLGKMWVLTASATGELLGDGDESAMVA